MTGDALHYKDIPLEEMREVGMDIRVSIAFLYLIDVSIWGVLKFVLADCCLHVSPL